MYCIINLMGNIRFDAIWLVIFIPEDLLTNFSQQKDSWRHCLYFVTTTHNEYVIMYCCTVLEVRTVCRNCNTFNGHCSSDELSLV